MKLSEIPGRIVQIIWSLRWHVIIVVVVFEVVTNFVLSYFQVEAESGLNFILVSEHGHFQSYGEWTEDFSDIVFGFDNNYRYAFFLSPTEYEGRPLEELGLAEPVDFEALGAPEPGLTEDGFVAVAIGNIDFDEKLDVWWADQDNGPRNSRSDVFGLYRLIKGIF